MKVRAHRIEDTARIAAAIAAAGAAAVALAVPASAKESLLVERYVGINDCSVVGAGQICPVDAKNNSNVRTQFLARTNRIKVEFTGGSGCSDIIAHVLIGGGEWGSNRVGPGESNGGYEIPVDPGLKQVAIQAEGIPGGCNTGSVSAWGGTLRIWALS